jgi:hypothetical protein
MSFVIHKKYVKKLFDGFVLPPAVTEAFRALGSLGRRETLVDRHAHDLLMGRQTPCRGSER